MRAAAQWTPTVVGPLAWLVFLLAEYALTPWACGRPTSARLLLYGVAVLTLLGAVLGGVLSWRLWSIAGGRDPDEGPPGGRSAFLALTGLGSNLFFALVIVAASVALFVLRPCE
jgi:hypothetical protein